MKGVCSAARAAIACGLLAISGAATSATITYDFTVTGTSGPLSGVTESGYLSYESSIVVPGNEVIGTPLLTDLSFTWNGIAYDETTANTGSLSFDASGALEGGVFGNTCPTDSTCTVSPGENEWFILLGSGTLVYATDGTDTTYRGTVTYEVARVPAPVPLALLGIGIATIGLTRRKRLS
jgi:hypothetical protein